MTEQHKTGEEVLASRLGDLGAMVVLLSRAVEQLATNPDEDECHQIAAQMRELRAGFSEWGIDLQKLEG